jgi:glycosyltransferase involved in cell wall biosynthesis
MKIVQILPPGERADSSHSGAIFQVATYFSKPLSHFFDESLVLAQDLVSTDNEIPRYHYEPTRLLRLVQLSNLISLGFFPLHIGNFEILTTEIADEDVIIVHNNPWLFNLVKRRYPENRVLFYAHNDVMTAFSARSKRKILEGASLILVISEYIARQFADLQVFRVLVLPNSTSNEIREEFLGRDFLNRTVDILYAGRISKEKGLHILLRSYGQSSLRSMKLNIVVAGGQTHNSDLVISRYAKRQIRRMDRLGINHVGRVPNEKVLELLRNSRFAVIPSIWNEPFSLFALEALRCGAIPIYFDGGGIMEATGGKGIIVSQKTIMALRRTLDNQVASLLSRPESVRHFDLTAPGYSWEDNALRLIRQLDA